ncbi:MAG TPA: type II secretion system F family protein [Syntrophales bacterium]
MANGRKTSPETIVHTMTDVPLSFGLRFIAFIGWALPHVVGSESLEWDLIQAGYRRPQARQVLAGMKVAFTFLFGCATLLACMYGGLSKDKMLALSLTMGLLGYFVPSFWVAYKRSRRREEITLALPDALDLMVICVEAGQGLNAALLSVGREINLQCRALSEELKLVNYEIRIGQSRGQALRNFALRTGVAEVRALAAVLIQSDRLGTSIGKALRVHAGSMRTRRKQRAEEAARKTAVKLVFPLVFFIFPELLVVILAPAVIQLIRSLAQ